MIKSMLKEMAQYDRKDFPFRLNDALLAICTTYKTPIEMYPFRLISGKPYLLLVNLQHYTFGALDFDMQ